MQEINFYLHYQSNYDVFLKIIRFSFETNSLRKTVYGVNNTCRHKTTTLMIFIKMATIILKNVKNLHLDC